jgi:hypothetical protein
MITKQQKLDLVRLSQELGEHEEADKFWNDLMADRGEADNEEEEEASENTPEVEITPRRQRK